MTKHRHLLSVSRGSQPKRDTATENKLSPYTSNSDIKSE